MYECHFLNLDEYCLICSSYIMSRPGTPKIQKLYFTPLTTRVVLHFPNHSSGEARSGSAVVSVNPYRGTVNPRCISTFASKPRGQEFFKSRARSRGSPSFEVRTIQNHVLRVSTRRGKDCSIFRTQFRIKIHRFPFYFNCKVL